MARLFYGPSRGYRSRRGFHGAILNDKSQDFVRPPCTYNNPQFRRKTGSTGWERMAIGLENLWTQGITASGVSTTASAIKRAAVNLVATKYNPSCVLYVPFDGTNGSSTFSDTIGRHTVTQGNTETLSTSVKKYGSASVNMTGSGTGVQATSNLGDFVFAGDFTVEFWGYLNSMTTQYAWGSTPDTTNFFIFGWYAGGGFWELRTNVSTFGSSLGATSVSLSTWYHFSVNRVGSTITLYIDGTATGTTITNSATLGYSNTWGMGGIGAYSGVPWDGYIDDFVVYNGTALRTGNFTAPTAPYGAQSAGAYLTALVSWRYAAKALIAGTYNPSCVLYVPFDGTNGSSTFIDNIGRHTITAGSTEQLSTSVAKFGTASLNMNGEVNGPTVTGNTGDFVFTGDLTIESWVYYNTTTSDSCTFAMATGGSTIACFGWGGTGLGYWRITLNSATNSSFGGSAPSTGAWHHLALVRSSGVFTLYLDGTALPSTVSSAATWGYNATAEIGGIPAISSGQLDGYVDDLAVYNGFAKYTSNFTPPALPISSTPMALVASVTRRANKLVTAISTLVATLTPSFIGGGTTFNQAVNATQAVAATIKSVISTICTATATATTATITKLISVVLDKDDNAAVFTSSQFNVGWTPNTGVVVTPDVVMAPSANTTGDKVTVGTANQRHYVTRNATIEANTPYTFSVFAKAGEYTYAGAVAGKSGSPFTRAGVIANLTTGSFTYYVNGTPTSYSGSVQYIAFGWYRLVITVTADASSTDGMAEVWPSASGTSTFTGDGTSGVYFWGARLESGSQATPVTGLVLLAMNMARTSPWYLTATSSLAATLTATKSIARALTATALSLAATLPSKIVYKFISLQADNWFTWSNRMTHWGASNVSVLELTYSDPVGGTTAGLLSATGTGALAHSWSLPGSMTVSAGQKFTMSAYLKFRSGTNGRYMRVDFYGSTMIVDFLYGKIVSNTPNGATTVHATGVVDAGDGWYRFWITQSYSSGTTTSIGGYMLNNSQAQTFDATVDTGIQAHIWQVCGSTQESLMPPVDTQSTVPQYAAGAKILSATTIKAVSKFVTATKAITATLTAIKTFLRTLTATAVGTTATMLRQVAKPMTATALSLVAIVSNAVQKTISVVSTLVASLVATFVPGGGTFNQAVNATQAVTATLERLIARMFTATALSLVATMNRTSPWAVSATQSITATISAIKTFLRDVTTTVALQATIVRQITHELVASLTLTATNAMEHVRTLAASLTLTATLLAGQFFLRALDATTSATATISTLIAKVLTAQLTMAATIDRLLTLFRTLDAALGVTATVEKLVSTTATTTQAVTVTLDRAILKLLETTTTITTTLDRLAAKLLEASTPVTATTQKLVYVTLTGVRTLIAGMVRSGSAIFVDYSQQIYTLTKAQLVTALTITHRVTSYFAALRTTMLAKRSDIVVVDKPDDADILTKTDRLTNKD